jgi:hypothetical protein
MEPELYTVYIFHLQNGWRFLYPKNKNIEPVSAYELMKECSYLYGLFDDSLQIVDIIQSYNNILHYNINSLVLYYMNIYGTEQVRGGKYSSIVLSPDEKNEISELIKYFSYGIEEEELKIARYYKYEIEYNGFLEKDFLTALTLIDDKLFAYNEIKQKYNTMNIVGDNEIREIQWLKHIIEVPVDNFRTIETRYNNVMNLIYKVYKFYKNEFEDADEKLMSLQQSFQAMEIPIWFYSPHTFFDNFIIHKNVFHLEHFLPYIMAVIEMTFYTIYNRLSEMDFEMKHLQYQENVEKKMFIMNRLNPTEV